MDVFSSLDVTAKSSIRCVEMHTTGEPTRIIFQGYPDLKGTLLEQRAAAVRDHDAIRQQIILEPRGHFDMYGAILRPKTELTESGEAHMGVLFLTNEGYSTMCGHATIALGRFLLDTQDHEAFPQRDKIKIDADSRTALLLLHAPCGLLRVTVPVKLENLGLGEQWRSDPQRPVSYASVPSFATGMDIDIPISADLVWPQLNGRGKVRADFSYGGAFFCIVSAEQLGFPAGYVTGTDLGVLSQVVTSLFSSIRGNQNLHSLYRHPDAEALSFLYSVMIVDEKDSDSESETGLCYFADNAIDRSPTGSGVAARVALAFAKGQLGIGQGKTYHSLVSRKKAPKDGFVGKVCDEVGELNGFPVVRVNVQGHAYYTGTHTFVVEVDDDLGEGGFLMRQIARVGF